MKLMQKLATVLVVATVATAIPVVTQASPSENRVNRVITVTENTSFTTTAAAVSLVIDAPYIETGDVFYLTLENAEWVNGAATQINVEGLNITCYDKKEAAVKVTDASIFKNSTIRIPLLTTVTGGEAIVHIDSGSGAVKSESITFAYVVSEDDEVFKITVDGTKAFYDEGEIGGIVFSEVLQDALVGKSEKDRTVLIELNNPDFEFKLPANGKIQLNLSRGFANGGTTTVNVAAEYTNRDCDAIKFVIPELDSDSRGVFTVKGINVISTVKAPGVGDLTVDVSGPLLGDVYDLKVATISEYGSKLEVADKAKVDILAGRTDDISFVLSEIIADSMVSNRYVEFELSEGYFAVAKDTTAENLALIRSKFKTLKNGDKNMSVTDVIEDVITKTVDDVEYIVGFEFKIPSTIDKKGFTFKLPITLPLDVEGSVKIQANGRGIGTKLETVVAEAKKAINVEVTPAKLNVGIARQIAGAVTITETDKGVMERGKDLILLLESESGMTFKEVPEIKVTKGDLQLDVDNARISKVTLEDGTKVNAVVVQVKKASKTASEITIKDFDVTVDRTVPDGNYRLEIGGSAITESTTLKVDNFATVGDTKNEVQKVTLESIFTIGSNTYTVNGVPKQADAAVYLSEKNRTMVPVRYLAAAIGVKESEIQYAQGVVTIFYGNDIIQMERNKAAILKNGIAIPTDEAITIKEGRAYAPIAEIARVLGIEVNWNPLYQTATFKTVVDAAKVDASLVATQGVSYETISGVTGQDVAITLVTE